MKVILLAGKAEAGKTTAATFMKTALEENGYKAAVIPYGDYVKHTAKLLFDWDGKKDEAGRQLLQWWGTDVVRAYDPNFWVDTVMRLAAAANDILDVLIIDDCRFPNEIEAWKDSPWDVTTILIERPNHENALTPEQRQHPSETALDEYKGFDLIIVNNCIIESLRMAFSMIAIKMCKNKQEG